MDVARLELAIGKAKIALGQSVSVRRRIGG
jgi:hypothetical protein